MIRYAAFLRGITAGINASMDDLRKVFEELGYRNVQTVVSSGNVLFEKENADERGLEQRIEEALKKELALNSAVIIRTEEELRALAASEPFKNMRNTPKTKPYVTFLKKRPEKSPGILSAEPGKGYSVLRVSDREIISVVDLTSGTTPDLMAVLDRAFGKEITTRSWNTVQRVLGRWDGPESSKLRSDRHRSK